MKLEKGVLMRTKKRWIIITVLILAITLVLSIERIKSYIKETTIPNYSELTHIGYSEQQIKVINTSTSDELNQILASAYQPDIVKRLTIPHYAALKDKGYLQEDVTTILLSDEILISKLINLPLLKSWQEYLNQPVYRSIIDAGYSEAIAQVLSSLKEVDITKILTYGYKPEFAALITSNLTVSEDLEAYLAYWKIHPEFNLRSIQEIVNTENDRPNYTGITSSDLTKGNLVLVNKYYSLPSAFIPVNLTTINVCGSATLISEAADALSSMCTAMNAAGLHPKVTSSYRSYATQVALYNLYAAQDGKNKADTYSARAGHSEHQTGLVVDMITPTSTLESFKTTAESRWLLANAQNYGFILRYTQSKQAITGYISEPWHWRYVGINTAADFNAKGMTFDEYYRLYIK
jgi:LAS superfamily LD-carboxypeptidase LdcB